MSKTLLHTVTASCLLSTAGWPASSRRYAHRLTVGMTMLAGLVMLIGCHNPAAERRIVVRERHIQATAEMLVQRERLPEAQQRLQRTADFVRRVVERDGEEHRRDMRALRAWFEYDCNRWLERQESYRRRLEQIFGGKPENIEPTAIIMLF